MIIYLYSEKFDAALTGAVVEAIGVNPINLAEGFNLLQICQDFNAMEQELVLLKGEDK
jgi:hypothetical protein